MVVAQKPESEFHPCLSRTHNMCDRETYAIHAQAQTAFLKQISPLIVADFALNINFFSLYHVSL